MHTVNTRRVQLTARHHHHTIAAAVEDTVPVGAETHRMVTEEPAYSARGGDGDGFENLVTAGTAAGEHFGIKNDGEEWAATARMDAAESKKTAAAARRRIGANANDAAGGPGRGLGHQHHKRNNCREMTAKQAEWDR